MSDIRLTELIELKTLQMMQDTFTNMTGIASIITDTEGIPITKPRGFCKFCAELMRESQESRRSCHQCDKQGAIVTLREGHPTTYICHAGLYDFAAPIMAGGKQLGCFVGGQRRVEPYSEEEIETLARRYDLDLEQTRQALSQIGLCTREELVSIAAVLNQFAEVLSELAYNNYVMKGSVQALRESLKVRSQFIVDIEQDLRTSIRFIVEQSEKVLFQDMPENTRKFLLRIRETSRNALSYLDDSMDYARMDEGKLGVREVEYNISELMDDIVIRVQNLMENRDVELKVDICGDMPKVLYGDVGRIKQILYNLVTNAIKFTEEGYVVVRMDMERKLYGMELCMEVRDTGKGMREEELQYIRDIFEGREDAENPSQKSTGLGIRVTRRLVEFLYGTIHVDSIYGEGTRYEIRIPQLAIGAEELG